MKSQPKSSKTASKRKLAAKPGPAAQVKSKPKTKRPPKKHARPTAKVRAVSREKVARQSVPCDCEANDELGARALASSTARTMRAPGGFRASSADWRVAKSLLRLRAQVNAKAPSRSKSHDGTIGDTNHQNRNSDHNPWVDDGVVTAMDITHDSAHGCDVDAMAEAIRSARDSRVKYLIWNRRICNHAAIGGADAWAWRAYNGANPHDQHLHISVKSEQESYDDESDWPV